MGQFKYILKICCVFFSLSKKLFALTALQITLTSTQPMVSIILSARIVQQLIDNAEPRTIALTAALLVGFNLIAGLFNALISSRISILNNVVKDDFCLLVGQKIMKLSYERLEDPKLLDLKQQSIMPIIQYGRFELLLNESVPRILGSIMTIAATAVIVARSNVFLMIPTGIVTVLCIIVSNKRQQTFIKAISNVMMLERKMGYFGQLAVDFSSGKEIRLFGMDGVIMKKIKQFSGDELFVFSKMLNSTTRYDVFETIFTQSQIFLIYSVVAWDVLNRGLSIGGFMELTGLFANLCVSVLALSTTLVALVMDGIFFKNYFDFVTLPVDNLKSDIVNENTVQDVEIHNVSFTYAHTKKEILSDINLTIPAGKKVALVGENGCGKTTLVKLICGLLKPTEGEIQIGGRAVSACASKSVSAVFQDFKLFAFSIRENVEMSMPGQADAVDALERVGLLDDVEKLEKGIETPLFKSYDNAGVELSGGQGQKLAIARAIYKDTGVILLDEPTAALDPKAEAEIFNNFQTITTGKTAILVSHRLSSCRFCDHIVVLDNGRVIEQGTHDELMLVSSGKYREMFTAQAEYYESSQLECLTFERRETK